MGRDAVWQMRCVFIGTGLGLLLGFYGLTQSASTDSSLGASEVDQDSAVAFVTYLGVGALLGAAVGLLIAVIATAVRDRWRRS